MLVWLMTNIQVFTLDSGHLWVLLTILSVEYGGMKYQENNEIGCPGKQGESQCFQDISVANKLVFIEQQ